MFYDSLLLLSLWFVATLPVLGLTRGEAVKAGNLLFSAYVVGVAFLFFAWFWVHGGQTLGMRAWRLRLVALDGNPITWGRAARRFAAAIVSLLPLGLGLLWVLIDRDGMSWHDRLSSTKLVVVPRPR